MRYESEFCTTIVKSMHLGYKIPDESSNFASSSKRCFDIIGSHSFNSSAEVPVYIEAKFNKSLSAFNLKRIEEHQSFYLSEFNKIENARCFIILGVYVKRGDLRAYIFNWSDLKPYYDNKKSIHAKALAMLPYNSVIKNHFSFDNIITDKELSLIFC